MQLAEIFIFQWSLKLHKAPSLLKDSIIVPVPKIQNLKTPNYFRSVLLTSLVMKTFEKIVKNVLLNTVQDKIFNSLTCPSRGVDDATGTLLNMVLKHLEGTKSFVHLLPIDFSSAFNCFQPYVLADRLNYIHNIDAGLIC